MTKRIIRSIILVATVAVVLSAVIIISFVNRSYSDKIMEELRTESELIAQGAEMKGIAYMEHLELEDMRVTWIDRSGRVIFDSEGRNGDGKNIMKSEDVEEAFRNGSGSSTLRYASISSSSMSYSVRLRDNTVIRVTDVHASFAAQLAVILTPLLVFLALVAAVSVLLAERVSRRIVRPINDIDLDRPQLEGSYPELKPLLDKLRSQNRRVGRQMEELRRSREQFSLITDSMSEGIILADPKLTVLVCNSGALRLLGSESDPVGQSIYSLNNSERFRRCVQDAAGGRHSDCVLRTESGDREVIASPAKSIDIITGVVVFIMDVTEKEKLETMRREFTSNVSHELKTPLTTIYGIADMLESGMVKPDDVAGFGGNIRSEAEKLINLINDIVALSKLDEGSTSVETEDVDLLELAQSVIKRLELSAAEKDVTTAVTGSNVVFSGSRTILEEIIYNLCDNGIKYNKNGGALEVKVSHVPKTAIITVSDTGMGIPKEHIDRIFERFYRVDKSRSRKIKGTGLGLSIVKHGVMYHGGTVRAESVPGKGTVFTVELPLGK
ncbi:MAG: PAS domain-containing protein [Ruminococcus sp.]|nr:PAS domain-containing protein [Ruminococcus sp.]